MWFEEILHVSLSPKQIMSFEGILHSFGQSTWLIWRNIKPQPELNWTSVRSVAVKMKAGLKDVLSIAWSCFVKPFNCFERPFYAEATSQVLCKILERWLNLTIDWIVGLWCDQVVGHCFSCNEPRLAENGETGTAEDKILLPFGSIWRCYETHQIPAARIEIKKGCASKASH